MPGRILVVDDTPTSRFLTRSRLGEAYYDVIEAGSGAEAIALARAEQPDMILLDVVMPGMDGFETCATLKAMAETAHIPVVLLTALDDRANRMRGLESGCDDFLSKPFEDAALLARVRSLTRMKMVVDELRMRTGRTEFARPDPAMEPDYAAISILLVERDAALARGIGLAIRAQLGCHCRHAGGEAAARALMRGGGFDAYVVGADLDDGDPMRLASILRGRPGTRNAVLMMMFRPENREHPTLAIDMGVSDYVLLPPDYPELAARLRVQLRRKHYSDRLRQSLQTGMERSVTDPLTGLHNRHYSDLRLADLIDRSESRASPLAVLALDLDGFKTVNDRFGHAVGDRVLAEFARRLGANVRDGDLLARIGGEEFLIAMPDLQPDAAAQVAERIRRAVETPAFTLDTPGGTLLQTVSIGIAFHEPGERAEALIERADRALYASKAAGRNRVTTAAA